MNNYFNFKETGGLKLDKIFFESYYPILFTCINKDKNIFLCVCCQADSVIRKWLVTDVSPKTIIDLLENKITIRDSFLKDKGSKYTIIYDVKSKDFQIKENDLKDWDEIESIDLPEVGEYMDSEEGEFLEEIEYFKDIEIRYGDYTVKEIVKITNEEILQEKCFSIDDYENTFFNVKYVIEGMADLQNNYVYEVICNITKNKISLDVMDRAEEGNLDNFTVFKNSMYKPYDKEEFCINSNDSNLKLAS